MAHNSPTRSATKDGDAAWYWMGPDERGRELEVIAVETQGERDDEMILLVIHVMPNYRGKERR